MDEIKKQIIEMVMLIDNKEALSNLVAPVAAALNFSIAESAKSQQETAFENR